MHGLFVTSLLPTAEPTTGFEIANRAILNAYRAAGMRLTIAGFQRNGGPPPAPGEIHLGELAIENATAGLRLKAGWVAKALAERLPVAAAKLRVLSNGELLQRLAAAGPVDVVILNAAMMPAAYPVLLDLAPSIFVAHNVEHVSAQENAKSASSPIERGLYLREARLLRRIEERLCARASAVHTLSAADAAPLGLGGARPALMLPLSVGRPPLVDDGRRDHDIGLIGTWSWAPNRAGLDWFLRQVVPLLPSTITVAVAGGLEARPAAPSNVTFLGRVPDAQRFLSASRVVALATTGGTGVQLKTIETLEAGMPAVATRAALRGIDGDLPGNVREADDAAGFALALVETVEAERAGRLTRRDGRDFVARRQQGAVEAVCAGLARVQAAQGRPAAPCPATGGRAHRSFARL